MTKIKLQPWFESCDLDVYPASGSRIRMLTSAPAITHNIYCEQPYCSADGNRLALLRHHELGPDCMGDLLLYDIKTYRIARLEREVTGVCCHAWSGVLYVTMGRDQQKRLVKIDLNTLEREELFPWGDLPGSGLGAISADQRTGLLYTQKPPQDFRIYTMDLQTRKTTLIHQSPDIINPHLQFRLHNAKRIMIQENRGGLLDAEGYSVRSCDARGVGLYSIAADGSDRKDFPVGPPHTPSTTGHECWIGDTDRAMVTLGGIHDDGEKRGNVLEVSHDRPKARVVFESTNIWNHMSVSRCGKFFVTDAYGLPGVPILLGCIKTGKTRILCEALTTGGGGQYTHAHPYITSDNKWVVYNSDRTGLAQAYLAAVPDGFLEKLED